MSKSLNVKVVGQRQKYNFLDPEAMQRAQKAINQRITDIALTFGVDSQIYRDYIAPLQNDVSAQYVRIDKSGLTKLKTGKGLQESEDARAIIKKMLAKATKGEILESTAEQFGGAVNLKQKQKIKTKKGVDVEIIPMKDVLSVADAFHKDRSEMFSRLNEIYELAEQEGVKNKEDYLKRYKWYRELKKNHGRVDEEIVKTAMRSLNRYSNEDILKIQKEGATIDRF